MVEDAKPAGIEEEETRPSTPMAIAAAATVEVIDVSSFQGSYDRARNVWSSPIDWAAVRADGISAVIIKASEGLHADGCLIAHARGARAAGLKVGVYHYFHLVEDLALQANLFATLYRTAASDLIPFIDVEPQDNPPTKEDPRVFSGAEWLEGVLDFANLVTQAVDARPLIYSFPSFWNGLHPETRPELLMYGLWVASYETRPLILKPWSDCVLWQYTDKGSVKGIAGKVDRSRSRGPLSTLLRAA